MGSFCKKYKKILICLCILIMFYVLIPVLTRHALPFHLFHLDKEEVTAIEVTHWDTVTRIEDPNELEEVVERLNHTWFQFWIPVIPSGGADYVLHIYKGKSHESYSVGPGYFEDGIMYHTDMEYITTDIIPY